MATKKYYAVRKGLKTGIFQSWTDCQAATAGYSNAEFKSFPSKAEAEHYLEHGDVPFVPSSAANSHAFDIPEGKVIAYVDGSYDNTLKKYSFGCVLLTPSGRITRESGNGDNPESLAIRNVAGEMLGAMFAAKWAIANGFREIEIRYDYEGIEKWVTGVWKAKNDLTQKYAAYMNSRKNYIRIIFQKVAAHSNNLYNDEADRLAKDALISGQGIPKIK